MTPANSNPQSQQPSGHIPTPWKARPLAVAIRTLYQHQTIPSDHNSTNIRSKQTRKNRVNFTTFQCRRWSLEESAWLISVTDQRNLNSKRQSDSSEDEKHSTDKKNNPRLLLNTKVHLPCLQEPASRLRHDPPESNPQSHISSTLILFSHLQLNIPPWPVPSKFPTECLEELLVFTHDTCPADPIPILSDQHSITNCNFVHLLLRPTPSLTRPHILLSIFSWTT